MKTFASQVYQTISKAPWMSEKVERHLTRQLQVINAATHFVLDASVPDINAFSKEGIKELIQCHTPYDKFTISTEFGGARYFIIVEVNSGLQDGISKKFVVEESVVSIDAWEFAYGQWVMTNYVMCLSVNGVQWGWVDDKFSAGFSEQAKENTRLFLKLCANVVGALLGALTCKNVRAETIEPAPKSAVNARRVRDGKSPLYATHTLVVHASKPSPGQGTPTGGHASPRQHLRRGHIRRLPTGNTWVQSCVVGTGDFLAKDYRVTA